jgi:hypothetical protein
MYHIFIILAIGLKTSKPDFLMYDKKGREEVCYFWLCGKSITKGFTTVNFKNKLLNNLNNEKIKSYGIGGCRYAGSIL